MSGKEKVLDQIQKLLAKGNDSGTTPAEAQVFIAKAQEMMLRHNLSMGDLKDQELSAYEEQSVAYDFAMETKYVRSILDEYFFVKILLNPRLKVWLVLGTKENVAIAMYMAGHIRAKMDEAWWKYKEDNEIEGIRGKTDFIFGFFKGLRDKLEAEKARLKDEEGLVWLGDPKLKEFQDSLHPSVGEAGKTKQRMSGDDIARFAGHVAGKNVQLNQGIAHGAHKVAALPPKMSKSEERKYKERTGKSPK